MKNSITRIVSILAFISSLGTVSLLGDSQDVVNPALFTAIEKDSLQAVNKAVEDGANVHAKVPDRWMPESSGGRALLFSAAGIGLFAYAAPIALGVGVYTLYKYKHPSQRTALHLAAQYASQEARGIIAVLIEAGLPVDIKDGYGKTALVYAIDAANVGAVATLIDNGADISEENLVAYAKKRVESYASSLKWSTRQDKLTKKRIALFQWTTEQWENALERAYKIVEVLEEHDQAEMKEEEEL